MFRPPLTIKPTLKGNPFSTILLISLIPPFLLLSLNAESKAKGSSCLEYLRQGTFRLPLVKFAISGLALQKLIWRCIQNGRQNYGKSCPRAFLLWSISLLHIKTHFLMCTQFLTSGPRIGYRSQKGFFYFLWRISAYEGTKESERKV